MDTAEVLLVIGIVGIALFIILTTLSCFVGFPVMVFLSGHYILGIFLVLSELISFIITVIGIIIIAKR